MAGKTGLAAYGAALGELKTRFDGWFNLLTGLGVLGKDKSKSTQFCPGPWLRPQECADLLFHDDVCDTIASIYPEEALRRQFTLKGPDEALLKSRFKALDIANKIQQGAAWGRAFGGAIGVMYIDDGRTCDQPVDFSRPQKIKCIDLYDPREAQRWLWFQEASTADYAKTKAYLVSPQYGGQFLVHKDRVLHFRGKHVGNLEHEQLAGWDASVYQAVLDVCMQFNNGYMALGNMLTDASQTVLKMHGLLGMLGSREGQGLIATRAQMFDLTRSVARSVFLDAEMGEDLSKVKTDFAGVPDVIDRFASRLSAATRIPVTVFMGISPAGMNATGESDIRLWYDRVESYRTSEIAPHVDRVIQILAGPNRGNEVEWPSLWQPSPKEAAETRKTILEGDQILLDQQVASIEEVAEARLTGSKNLELVGDMRRHRPQDPALSGAKTAAPQLPPGK